tara:strand:+ start:3203 stop:3817 length:615 start_codon:yes stop_codon:yes gene_type:complete
MRKKVYYTPQEIINNLYTIGNEWMTTDYTEYKGLYHRYTTGEVYTEHTWNKNKSKRLIKYQQLPVDIKVYNKTKKPAVAYENNIKSYKSTITPADKKQGVITRYFIKRYDSENITEISQSTYDLWTKKKIDNNIYLVTELQWVIGQTYTKIDINKNILLQVQQLNQTVVNSVSSAFSNLKTYLTDYIELYVDLTYTTPPDINNI